MTSSENCLILVNSDEFNTVDIRKMLIIRKMDTKYIQNSRKFSCSES